MDIREYETNGIIVVGLSGRLDATTADLVKQKLLARAAARQVRLVIDFSQVVYVSSIGLRVLLEVAKRVAAGQGRVALCAMVTHVAQVFELAGFATLIPILPTQADALASLA